MVEQSRAEKKLLRRERRFDREQRMRIRRSEEYEALEEVFDKPTLMLIYRILNRGILSELGGVVSAGKESRVYFGEADGREVAVKIYLTGSAEFRKGMMPYIVGDRRFSRYRKGVRSIIRLWARKEFVNLREFRKVGVPVPEPLHVEGNILIMQFIGKDGIRAPLLNEMTPPDPAALYDQLLSFVRLMIRDAGLVHGDLSEFNVMIHDDRPFIIDVSQSLPLSHPLASEMLARDISNVNKYFSGLGVEVLNSKEFFEELTRDESA